MRLEDIEHPLFLNALSRFEDYIMLERGCSENTLKAYSSDLRQWFFYCRKMEFDPLVLNSDNIARFLREQSARGMSKGTVQRNGAVLKIGRAHV